MTVLQAAAMEQEIPLVALHQPTVVLGSPVHGAVSVAPVEPQANTWVAVAVLVTVCVLVSVHVSVRVTVTV